MWLSVADKKVLITFTFLFCLNRRIVYCWAYFRFFLKEREDKNRLFETYSRSFYEVWYLDRSVIH